MENSSRRFFLVTKHAVGAIIDEGAWALIDTQVIAVMRAAGDDPAPLTLSKAEFEKQKRAWLMQPSVVVRRPEDFIPVTRPVFNHRFEYLDETVYATWAMA